MKVRILTLGLVILLVVTGAFRVVRADDETEAFIREVIKDARTDSDRSALLAEAVSLAGDNKKLKVALLEKALYYGMKRLRITDDCRRCGDILTDLVKSDPDRRSLWLSRQALVYRRWSVLEHSPTAKRKLAEAAVAALTEAGIASAAEGDWKKALGFFNQGKSTSVAYKLPNRSRLMGYIRTATHIYKAQDKIAGHIATLKKSPDKLDARSDLITKLVTVMDDPGGALKYVNADVDEKFRMFVPMAVKNLSELSVEASRNLGDWYLKELSKSAAPVVKSRMLVRAKACYERALQSDTGGGVQTARLKLSISQIKSEREKLGKVDPLLCSHCSATGKMPCRTCQGTGMRNCRYCKGTGRGKCSSCRGAWRVKCSRCSGRGRVVSGSRRVGGVVYKNYTKCYKCGGKGVTHRSRYGSMRPGPCPVCSKQPESLRGTSTCSHCSGKGGSGTCWRCRGAKVVRCSHCALGRSLPQMESDNPPDEPDENRPSSTSSERRETSKTSLKREESD